MCGRYASSRKPEDLVEEFEVDANMVKESLQPDYNVAPTKDVYAVMDRVPRDAPKDTAAERRLTTVRWGLVPSWAKDIAIGNRMINARLETLAEKPAFKRALAKRRCLLPADGYYEWYPTEQIGKSGQAAQAAVLHPPQGRRRDGDGRPLRDLAQQGGRRRRRARRVRLVRHGDHHDGRGLRRAHPRPDADAGRAGAVRRLAGRDGRRPRRPRRAARARRSGSPRGLSRVQGRQQRAQQRRRT